MRERRRIGDSRRNSAIEMTLFREFMSAKLRTGSTLEFGVHDAKSLGFVVVRIVVSVGYSNNR
jgi:hypothetical protein